MGIIAPLVADLLERSLLLDSKESVQHTPEVIVVLAAGYEVGYMPEQEILSSETARRVMDGIMWWKDMRASKLVMSGTKSVCENSFAVQDDRLMASYALCRGVP